MMINTIRKSFSDLPFVWKRRYCIMISIKSTIKLIQLAHFNILFFSFPDKKLSMIYPDMMSHQIFKTIASILFLSWHRYFIHIAIWTLLHNQWSSYKEILVFLFYALCRNTIKTSWVEYENIQGLSCGTSLKLLRAVCCVCFSIWR